VESLKNMKNRPPRSAGSAARPSFGRKPAGSSQRKDSPRAAAEGFRKGPSRFAKKPEGRREDPSEERSFRARPPRRDDDRPAFDKKPGRFKSRDDAPRAEGFRKAPSRFGKRPDDRAEASGERSFRPRAPRRDDDRPAFDKKPGRFKSRDEAAPRGEGFRARPPRRDDDRPAFDKKPGRFKSRDDGFRKAPSRFGKRPDDRAASGERSFRPRRDDAAPRAEGFRSKAPSRKPSAFKPKPFEERSERPRVSRSAKSSSAPQTQGSLLWGFHAVREAWLNSRRRCFTLWLTPSGQKTLEPALAEAEKRGLPRPTITMVEREELDKRLPRGSVHQGIALDVEPLPELSLDDLLGQDKTPTLVVILDQVTDPHNVGAIMRSAAAFGADAVIVTERNAPGTTGLLAKTACGALEYVPLVSVVNLSRTLEALREESFWCIGLAEEGEKELSGSKLSSGRIALVLGAEGEGLRRLTREHCDELVRLPTQGPIGSLNVSNAAVAALYEVKRQKSSH